MGSVHDLLRLLADCSELHTINYLNPDTDWLTNSPAVSRIVATPVAERRQQPARGGQVGDYNPGLRRIRSTGQIETHARHRKL